MFFSKFQVLISFGLLLATLATAQTKVDSLKAELKRTSDTRQKAILTEKIAETFFLTARYDSLVKVGSQLRDLAQQLDDEELTWLAATYQAQSHMRTDSIRFFTDAQQILKTCEANRFEKGIALNCLGLGSRLLTLGKYSGALQFLTNGAQAITTNSLVGIKSDLIRTKSAVYHHQGNYTEALDFGLESSRLAEQSGDPIQILKSYLNLGGLYGELSSPDNGLGTPEDRKRYSREAKKYMILSYTFSIPNASLLTQGATAFNLGSYYVEALEMDSARYYLNTAIRLGLATNFYELLSNAYRMKSRLYTQQPDSSVYYLDQAYDYATKAQNPITRVVTSLDKARVFFNQKKWIPAEQLINETLIETQKLNLLNEQRAAYLLLYEIKAGQQQYQQALENYKNYSLLKDSIISEKNFARIEELRTRYETDLKDREINFLEQKTELQDLELRQKNYVLAGVLAVALLLAGVIFLYFRQRSLVQQKKALDIENRFLRFQLDPHFLSNSLVSIQRFILESKTTDASNYLTKFAKLMRQLLEHSRKEVITLEEEIDLLRNYLDLQKLRFKESFEYDIVIDINLELSEVKIAPMFAQPFVENAIEHGVSKIDRGKITVSFTKLAERLKLEIMDNGPGLSNANSEHRSLSTTIIQERMNLINKSSKTPIELTISPVPDGSGVLVQLILPIYL